MGKGDIKTRRGKLFSGSYGKKRPTKKSKKGILKTIPAVSAQPEEKAEVQPPIKKVNTPLKKEAVKSQKKTETKETSKPVVDSPSGEKEKDPETEAKE